MTAPPRELTPPAAPSPAIADVSALRSLGPRMLESLIDGTPPPATIAPLAPSEVLVWLSLGSNLPLVHKLDLPERACTLHPTAATLLNPNAIAEALPQPAPNSSSAALTPTQVLIQALHALHTVCPVIALSSLWRTQPVDQPVHPTQQADLQKATSNSSDFPSSALLSQPASLSTLPAAPDFFNAAAVLRTSLTIEQVLALTQQIEQRFGRVRDPHYPKGPRTLDLDLILAIAGPSDEPGCPPAAEHALHPSSPRQAPSSARFGPPAPVPILRNTPTLFLPHPSMHLRRFVLAPMAELSPTLMHQPLHRTIGQLLHSLGPARLQDAVERLDTPAWPSLAPASAHSRASSRNL
jgi:2-amino-4-hydroxy-6-hydroxymethyldihydropteridine diphosphokinase